MLRQSSLSAEIGSGALDSRLRAMTGCDPTELPAMCARLSHVLSGYGKTFGPDGEVGLFSGPGRTEIGGNHTDHQRGRVLAAAINLDALACAGPNGTDTIRICSAGYPDIAVSLGDLTVQPGEAGTSAALVRGVAARFTALGHPVGGFNAYIESTVLGGSGLSSSAAYEVLIGVIVNHLFCQDAVSLVQIAQIGQYAENVYFGKPCGLMDQLASAVGGIVSIDFKDPETPIVHQIDYDLSASGHALCIIDSGADHADLTEDYAAIPREMGAVAAFFGKDVLRQVDYEAFWQNIPALRKAAGDRAVLRAIHFFDDNLCAQKQAVALESDNFVQFLNLVNQSGISSSEHLQNLYSASAPGQQALPLVIALARRLLGGTGAVRVHGGGFAGTVQAFVPFPQLDTFRERIEAAFGKGCCHVLRIRPEGGAVIAG